MQLRTRYTFLTLTTLAIFAATLIWPGFVIDSYVKFTEMLPRRVPAIVQKTETPQEILSGIDFNVSTNTPTSTLDLMPPNENADGHLIIPTIGVNGPVILSDTQSALNKGFWHIPGSAVPGQHGNIVVSSHRWLYRPPNPVTFYRIDEVKIGDPVYYNFDKKRYTYQVTETKVVDPTDVHILDQNEDKLTLFTCHPLFSTKQRYVVIAKLLSVTDIAS